MVLGLSWSCMLLRERVKQNGLPKLRDHPSLFKVRNQTTYSSRALVVLWWFIVTGRTAQPY